MPFSSDIRQFATPADLAAYLVTLPAPDWPGEHNPSGTTLHNTYRPLPSQWVGRPSMDGMVKTYIGKGWPTGPHMYFCLGAPNPAHDGIWQMAPLGAPGVHAGDCNPHRFGVEVVGDFEATVPSAAQLDLIVEGLAQLHHWSKLGADLVGHRDCMAKRTCPGQHLYDLLPVIRARLAVRLRELAAPVPRTAVAYRVLAPMWISETPTPRGPIALKGQAVVYAGDTVMLDEVRPDGWAHLANGVGFLPIGGLEKA